MTRKLTYQKISYLGVNAKEVPVTQISVQKSTALDHKWKNILFDNDVDPAARYPHRAKRMITVNPSDTNSSKYLLVQFNYLKHYYYYKLIETKSGAKKRRPNANAREYDTDAGCSIM
jgi:hypothetical protein